MIGKVAVHLAKQFLDLAAQGAEQLGSERAGHAVAAIDGDFQRAHRLHVGGDARDVFVGDVIGTVSAAALGEIAGFDAHAQRLDRLAGECLAAQYHLETVVVGGVVAAGDHHGGMSAQVIGGKIGHRCRHQTEIDHVDTALADALRQCRRERRPGEPAVASDDDGILLACHRFRTDGVSDFFNYVRRQGFPHYAAYIIGLEDFLG